MANPYKIGTRVEVWVRPPLSSESHPFRRTGRWVRGTVHGDGRIRGYGSLAGVEQVRVVCDDGVQRRIDNLFLLEHVRPIAAVDLLGELA